MVWPWIWTPSWSHCTCSWRTGGSSITLRSRRKPVAFVQSFAGGALLTMLADTMMPEAFKYGGKQVGLFTTLGFALAFLITTIE
jgi:zinc transporter ZupT